MLSLILPTYKEAESLPVLLPKIEQALAGMEYEVIVVDDDSPDGTWRVAQELSRKYPQVRVIRRVGRRGLSSAVIEGCLSAKGDVLAVADADGQHDLSILSLLYADVATHHGIAVGSRYAEGGSVGDWDERRHAMSRFATRLATKLCRVKVKDPMSGFFAIDAKLFQKTFRSLNPKGFKILLDLLIHVPASTPLTEVPFTFGIREKGESKLSRRVQMEFLEYLYDATAGRWLPLTFVKYCIVGAVGVLVNLLAYLITTWMLPGFQADIRPLAIPFLAGIEAAILFNFILNNSWTFATVRLKGWHALVGFVKFNLVCLFGALANYAVAAQLRSQSIGIVTSVVVGAAVGMIWNYTMSRMTTWRG